MINDHYPFVNTPLPYPNDALEPFIDAKTMEVHHDRLLQGYIDRLNALLAERPALQGLTLTALIAIAPHIDGEAGTALKRNAGGVFNHRFFFDSMTPGGNSAPNGDLADAVERRFGGWQGFLDKFRAAAMSVFGSGYAWLVLVPGQSPSANDFYPRHGSVLRGSQLDIVTSPNQDSPTAAGLIPIMCIDVWEHAYFLKHYNLRNDYISDWFAVADMARAEKLYSAAAGGAVCRER
jgi:Fe-Mn family superoxide dismutase